jgi:HEAT repeat protein
MLVTISNNMMQMQENNRTDLSFQLPFQEAVDSQMGKWLADLSPEIPWGLRQAAARNLGYLKATEAVPELVYALEVDSFWMVRCAIIQALEMIDDPRAIPVLRKVQNSDSFQVVRSYAAKVVERLSESLAVC